MRQTSARGRQAGQGLLQALHHGTWTPRALATLLGQLHAVYRQLLAFEARYRTAWDRDIPVSRLVSPMTLTSIEALEGCITALDDQCQLAIKPYTQTLCDTLVNLADHDEVAAFAITAIGGYWMEPALRAALREALWRQPGLYNGDTRFCWQPGGPEAEQRRQLWHGVMALGPVAGRTGRLAKTARLQWYDALHEAIYLPPKPYLSVALPLLARTSSQGG